MRRVLVLVVSVLVLASGSLPAMAAPVHEAAPDMTTCNFSHDVCGWLTKGEPKNNDGNIVALTAWGDVTPSEDPLSMGTFHLTLYVEKATHFLIFPNYTTITSVSDSGTASDVSGVLSVDCTSTSGHGNGSYKYYLDWGRGTTNETRIEGTPVYCGTGAGLPSSLIGG